ncbi:hypothetical protein BGZ63DRAFT_257575 [Mariannaea sp. PMI_226]|nr:hypothetical protein BGZ63DRAFT_257575 [Mariannaea sp. PMI_226]
MDGLLARVSRDLVIFRSSSPFPPSPLYRLMLSLTATSKHHPTSLPRQLHHSQIFFLNRPHSSSLPQTRYLVTSWLSHSPPLHAAGLCCMALANSTKLCAS